MTVIDGLYLCVYNGDLPNDFEVETIIGKRFDANDKVKWLVKWKACGLCEATWVPLNNHSLNVVCVKHNDVVNNRQHSQNTKASDDHTG